MNAPLDAAEQLKANAATQDFLLALGGGMSAWQKVEREIYQLFMLLCRKRMGGQDLTVPTVLYHATVHFESKLRLIDALVPLVVKDKAIAAQYTRLNGHINKRQKIRNKLAHWTVINNWGPNGFDCVILSPPITRPAQPWARFP